MNYKETLKSVDTEKALALIGIEFESPGRLCEIRLPSTGL